MNELNTERTGKKTDCNIWTRFRWDHSWGFHSNVLPKICFYVLITYRSHRNTSIYKKNRYTKKTYNGVYTYTEVLRQSKKSKRCKRERCSKVRDLQPNYNVCWWILCLFVWRFTCTKYYIKPKKSVLTNQMPETNRLTKQFIRLNKYDYCEIWYIVSFVWFDFCRFNSIWCLQ